MSEIERAIKALEKEKKFCRRMLKDLKEEELFLDAEQDYAKGNSVAQCDCYDFIKGADMAISALREKAEREKPCGFIHELYIEKRWAYCPHCGRKLVP